MLRTFFYTQIKTNDFKDLKTFCAPFTKDIFGANQEHIVAFPQAHQACTAALQFLNLISNRDPNHSYKVVLVDGELVQDRPQDLIIRIARSIHQHGRPKNLYFTDEVLAKIQSNDIVFEKKDAVWVKDLEKNTSTYALNRFENIELIVDPTDLFDFSQVDSYSSVDKVKTTDAPVPKSPFESSGTTLELATPKEKEEEAAKIPPPLPQQIPVVPKSVVSRPVQPSRHVELTTQAQLKSLVIILVLLLLVTCGGFYLARSKTPDRHVYSYSTKALPASEAGATAAETVPMDSFVNIHSTPSTAEVWINGEKNPKRTPIDKIKVPSKEKVTIDVQKSGYEKVTKNVELEPSETLTVLFQLSKATDAKSEEVQAPPPAAKTKVTPKKTKK